MRTIIILILLLALLFLFGCTDNQDASLPSDSIQISSPNDKETEESPTISEEASSEVTSEEVKENENEDEYQVVKETSNMDFSNTGVYEIKENTIYAIDVNKDGILENVSVTNTSHVVDVIMAGVPDKMTVPGDTYLTINNVDYEKTGMEWVKKAYVIRNETGKVGIVIFGVWMSDDYILRIYGFDGEQAVSKVDCDSELISINMESLSLRSVLTMLGTWFETKKYVLNDDFSLSETHEFAKIESIPSKDDYLKTKMEITVDILNKGVYSDTVLPAGSKIYPINEGYIDNTICLVFKTEDGSTGRLFMVFEKDYYINGISEYDIFENIKYEPYGAA